MKVAISWLSEFFHDALDAEVVAEKLTLSGIEVEHVQGVGAMDPRVVIGEVTSIEPLAKLPGTYRLNVQADRLRSIVSNAPSLEVGKRVCVALPGATVFAAPELALLEVEVSDLYGERSEGMLVHATNLGLGPDAEQPLEFDGATPGSPVLEVLAGRDLGSADRVLLLSILPNIARCQAMLGVAREVAALLALPLKETVAAPSFEATERLTPSIAATDACHVLTATLLSNVRVTESPEWLRRRLVLAGMTPINNVVDASNYVMLELGQPTHPYDAERLPSLDLGVRRARKGEKLLTLQQAEGEEPMLLPEGVPLIVSNDEPVALAGVLGGRTSAISSTTSRVLLESAAFDYVAIRKSQQAAKVYSEASARFSRGVNPELPIRAARRFIEVLRETSPALVVRGFGEVSQGVAAERRIELSLSELSQSLGAPVPLEEAALTLRRVGLEIAVQEDRLVATVGNARPDITLSCDLVEEIARLRGYDFIPETMPLEPIPERLHEDNRPREALRDDLVRAGLQEIISYSLSSPDAENRLYAGHSGTARRPAMPVQNPISVDRSILRTTLSPALLQAVLLNLRHTAVCRLFEVGVVFFPTEDPEAVPREREHVGIVLAGKAYAPTLHDSEPRPPEFHDLQAVILDLLCFADERGSVEFVRTDEAPYRPGAAARVVVNGRPVGTLGAVHPSVLQAFQLEGHAVLLAELSVAELILERPKRFNYMEYDRLPSIELDIAMVLDRDISASRVRQVVREAGGPLLRKVEAFDQFLGDQFGESKKALAIRLRLNAGERTLEMSEALEVRSRVARALERTLAVQIRE